jgi:cytochrome c oxidase accessory protein FixG
MCPWPRIQGAMLDEDSLLVTYNDWRGEPRSRHQKRATAEGLNTGDCVDCNACVVVCPMGIDIRDGGQLECINCGLCVDACDEIMVRLERPTGLIAYDTDAAVAAREAGTKPAYRLVRGRTVYYGAALALVSAVTLWGLTHRSPVELHVIRDRSPTFVRLHDGAVRNGYTLKIANRSPADRRFVIAIAGIPRAKAWRPGEVGSDLSLTIPAGDVGAIRVFVAAPAAALTAPSLPLSFDAVSGGVRASTRTVFLSGAANQP